MDGFKPNKKIQCFKEGGQVKYESRKEHKEEMSSDVAQDKAIVKKAFKLHDAQEHKGEKTNLSTLKKGGRSKKAVGTVNKFKAGGTITNVYEAKKSSGDKDNIQKVKDTKAIKLCGGKSVKKMAAGSLTGALVDGAAPAAGAGLAGLVQDQERKKRIAKYLGPAQQAQLASQQAQSTAAQPPNAAAMTAAPPQDQMGAPTGMPAQKKGGKVKK